MQVNKQSTKSRIASERGVYLVFTLLVLVVIIMIIALAIEVGRMLIAARQIQNAADSAALTGVKRLYHCDVARWHTIPLNGACVEPDNCPIGQLTCSSFGGWQAVKPAVIASLTTMRVLNKSVNPVRFSSGGTQCDVDGTSAGYGDLRYYGGGDSQFLSVNVIRQLECRNSGGSLRFLDIDGPSGITPIIGKSFPYCYANAVKVELIYSGISLPLARFFGVFSNKTISRFAVASMRNISTCQNLPPCSLLTVPPVPDCNPQCVS